VNEFRQVGLCFLKGDRGHPEVSEGPWSSRTFYQTVRRRLDHRRVEHPVAEVGETGKATHQRLGESGEAGHIRVAVKSAPRLDSKTSRR